MAKNDRKITKETQKDQGSLPDYLKESYDQLPSSPPPKEDLFKPKVTTNDTQGSKRPDQGTRDKE